MAHTDASILSWRERAELARRLKALAYVAAYSGSDSTGEEMILELRQLANELEERQ